MKLFRNQAEHQIDQKYWEKRILVSKVNESLEGEDDIKEVVKAGCIGAVRYAIMFGLPLALIMSLSFITLNDFSHDLLVSRANTVALFTSLGGIWGYFSYSTAAMKEKFGKRK